MRTKRVSALEQEVKDRADKIFWEFSEFTGGTRYIALLHRSKDGGANSEYYRRAGFYITHNGEEWFDAVCKLLMVQATSPLPYRLYASVNERDIKKGERKFKMDMLECDFAPQENHDYFWRRLESKWAGALMSPGSRAESLFLIDMDGEGDITAPALQWLEDNDIQIYKQYKTPNGWHIITDPFNPNTFNVPNAEIKKDALMLLNA